MIEHLSHFKQQQRQNRKREDLFLSLNDCLAKSLTAIKLILCCIHIRDRFRRVYVGNAANLFMFGEKVCGAFEENNRFSILFDIYFNYVNKNGTKEGCCVERLTWLENGHFRITFYPPKPFKQTSKYHSQPTV